MSHQVSLGNKRGVSVIIGYIMLIAIVVTISILVYQWMKSYVPADALQCPDGVSVSLPDYVYNCSTGTSNDYLNFTVENSGTFSIAGYFIKATTNPNQTIATLDLTPYFLKSSNSANGEAYLGAIIYSNFYLGKNSKDPGSVVNMKQNGFSIPKSKGTLYRIDVIPVRYVNYSGRVRFASCGSAEISQKVTCS